MKVEEAWVGAEPSFPDFVVAQAARFASEDTAALSLTRVDLRRRFQAGDVRGKGMVWRTREMCSRR